MTLQKTDDQAIATAEQESGPRLAVESDSDFTPLDSTYRDTLGLQDIDTNGLEDFKRLTPKEWRYFTYPPKGKLRTQFSRLLEQSDIDLDSTNADGRTPLSLAAGAGREWIVTRLLKRIEVNVNRQDAEGYTPLMYAIEGLKNTELRWPGWVFSEGHCAVVKPLLNREDIDPDVVDAQGRTPLSKVAEYGHEEIVRLFLVHPGADKNRKDNRGRTPLSWASACGHEAVVKLLLDCETVDPNSQDNEGHTPLSRAVEHGHVAIVELLLKQENIDPNYEDENGRTQLSRAAERGQEEIIKALMRHHDVDPELPDSHGQTPLIWAAKQGRDAATHLLLDIGVNPNRTDEEGSSPLLLAAKRGHWAIVEMLLSNDSIELNQRDQWGRTALSWAVCCAEGSQAPYHGDVELLLKESGIDPNAEDENGRAPLWWAVNTGHERFVKRLLEHDVIDPCPVDHKGETPLSCAAKLGHTAIAKLLIPKDDTTLHLLVQKGNLAQVTLLIKLGYDVNRTDALIQTPLHVAASTCWVEIARRLLSSGANIDPKNINGTTPIQLAIRHKHLNLVDLLLESGAPIKGIMAEDWRATYEPRASGNILEVLRKSGEAMFVHYLEGTNLQTLIEKGKSRRLVVFADHSAWSSFVGLDTTAFLRFHDLTYQIQNRDRRADITLAARFPLKKIPFNNSSGWGQCGISWTAIPPTGAKVETYWKTIDHFSTLPYGWIPESGADFVALFMQYLKGRWLGRCTEVEEHLSQRRLDQLCAKGQSSKLVHHLAEDARECSELRSILRTQIREIKKLAAEHSRYDNGRGPKILQEAIDGFDVEVNGAIKQLEQTVKDLLQFEFAWVSINEAHRSTSIATSIKRLSWITFIFLPAMFASSLFGMNVDILQNYPDWRWYILFGGGFIALTFLAWFLVKYGQLELLVERKVGMRLQWLVDRWIEPSRPRPTLEDDLS